MEYHKDWRNPEKETVVRERLQDIRNTKYADWFATFSYVAILSQSEGIIPLIEIAFLVFGILIITMIILHVDGREQWRDEIFKGLPEQSGSFTPYCTYKWGFRRNTFEKETIGLLQIVAVIIVMLWKLQ